jgi:Uma2 family endonuclease
MSTQPASSAPRFITPDHPLTAVEYLEIGEVEPGYAELAEGRLELSPSPVFDHGSAAFELGVQLRPQLPAELRIILDMDVDLQLAPADAPGTVRRPDLIVVRRDARHRIRQEGGLIQASEVVVTVEFLSPSSRRLDHMVKRTEYADAGIPHYWIVDLDEPVSLTACHLAGEFGYMDGGPVPGIFRTSEPFPVEVDLDALLD